MNFPKFWAQSSSGNFATWRWSDTSLDEAESAARQAVERLAARFAQMGRSAFERYGYPDRPLRELVLREFRNDAGELSAVVTRNSYGCQVLNTARAMFVDVDIPPPSHSAKLGSAIASLFGRKPQTPEDLAQAAIAKAEVWAKSQSSWNWRIYRTSAGVRLLATHALFDPADRMCQTVFDAVDADPLYRKLCQTQECFRARLTPKPWRCEIGNPPSRWPFPSPSAEAAFTSWNRDYQAACQPKASCRLLRGSDGYIHPELRPLVTLHDEMTRANSPLPLA